MKRSKTTLGPRSAMTLAVVSTAAGLLSAGSVQAESASKAPENGLEEIVISGIRKSLQESLETKKSAVNAVDSIASEDMGKMPDQNVAESLQRLPGITIARTNGVGNGVTVRGLGPQFNAVTINGRIMATDSAGREFNFDTLAPELIVGADVYKSPQANIDGASVGATIDIRTMRPLTQNSGLTFGGTLRANHADLNGSTTPAASVYTNWKNDAGTFGVSAVVSFDRTIQRTDSFYIGASTGADRNNIEILDSNNNKVKGYYWGRTAPAQGYFYNVDTPHNLTAYVDMDDRKRTALDATFQWKPADNLVFTFDALLSNLKENDHNSGPALDFSGGTMDNQIIVGGTTQTMAVFVNDADLAPTMVPVHVGGTAVYQHYINSTADEIVVNTPRDSKASLFGLNTKWTHGNLELALDLNATQATRNSLDAAFTTIRRKGVTMYWDKRSGGPVYDFGYFDPTLTGINTPTELNHVGAHYMQMGGSKLTDKTHEAKIDAKWSGDNTSLFAGIGFQGRDKDTDAVSQPFS
ncbi:MAG TPA: TonB-dependent receptor plug domain-containing protein, partial [Steroidobacteraceae bacterium]|nr:TonB-dependent receptor plug domain-containing protein [Steroidobacteraceae bacterium]